MAKFYNYEPKEGDTIRILPTYQPQYANTYYVKTTNIKEGDIVKHNTINMSYYVFDVKHLFNDIILSMVYINDIVDINNIKLGRTFPTSITKLDYVDEYEIDKVQTRLRKLNKIRNARV